MAGIFITEKLPLLVAIYQMGKNSCSLRLHEIECNCRDNTRQLLQTIIANNNTDDDVKMTNTTR